jgi:hypothetical protein
MCGEASARQFQVARVRSARVHEHGQEPCRAGEHPRAPLGVGALHDRLVDRAAQRRDGQITLEQLACRRGYSGGCRN